MLLQHIRYVQYSTGLLQSKRPRVQCNGSCSNDKLFLPFSIMLNEPRQGTVPLCHSLHSPKHSSLLGCCKIP